MSNQLQTKPSNPASSIRNYIASDVVKKQIASVLPKHLTADVMARVVLTAILKQPKLAECGTESLLQSIMLLSQFGLLPDGRSAHLIPYWNSKGNRYDCQAIIDWKGKVARATENGVENIAADVACMNDKFTWAITMDGLKFEHEIDFRKGDRGEVFAAYCVWRHAGKFSGVIMSKVELDGIRARSKSHDKGPWVSDTNEMFKKSVIHRASKLWPLDAKFRDAIEIQEVAGVVDLSEVPVVSEASAKQIVDDSNPDLNPAPKNLPEATPKETARQHIVGIIESKAIPFDGFVATVKAKNISVDLCDKWFCLEDVPDSVFETLAAQPKTIDAMITKFGKK